MDEDVGPLELADHLVRVGDEIGREVAAVELHAFATSLGLPCLASSSLITPSLPNRVHRLGDHVADRIIAVG